MLWFNPFKGYACILEYIGRGSITHTKEKKAPFELRYDWTPTSDLSSVLTMLWFSHIDIANIYTRSSGTRPDSSPTCAPRLPISVCTWLDSPPVYTPSDFPQWDGWVGFMSAGCTSTSPFSDHMRGIYYLTSLIHWVPNMISLLRGKQVHNTSLIGTLGVGPLRPHVCHHGNASA